MIINTSMIMVKKQSEDSDYDDGEDGNKIES